MSLSLTIIQGVRTLNAIYQDNNLATVIGRISEPPMYSHKIYEEKFYILSLDVYRLSNVCDTIKITVSERLMTSEIDLSIGKTILVKGQFRSYNNTSEIGNKLILTVFAKEIEEVEDVNMFTNPNFVQLNGYICKEPVYRKTPLGREITDILLAVNRLYNKSDYIPCIAWGRNAKFVKELEVGTNIKISGRIQSRTYQKRISETESIEKVAYEISVSKLEVINLNNTQCTIGADCVPDSD